MHTEPLRAATRALEHYFHGSNPGQWPNERARLRARGQRRRRSLHLARLVLDAAARAELEHHRR